MMPSNASTASTTPVEPVDPLVDPSKPFERLPHRLKDTHTKQVEPYASLPLFDSPFPLSLDFDLDSFHFDHCLTLPNNTPPLSFACFRPHSSPFPLFHTHTHIIPSLSH